MNSRSRNRPPRNWLSDRGCVAQLIAVVRGPKSLSESEDRTEAENGDENDELARSGHRN